MAALNNKILIGTNDETTATYVFENANIYSVDGEMAIGIIGDELTVDTLTPVVRYTGSTRLTIDYGTAVWWYNNSVLSGKFYVESVERTGKEQYQISCISVIGLLDTKKHAGSVYTGETFSTVLSGILSGTLTASTDYEVDSEAASIPVYGYLPYDSARENLHKLLMAYNVSMVKSATDASKIRFCFLGSDTATAIPSNRIYIDGSVDYAKMPTKVNITEHTYIAWPEGVEEKELFNNTDSGVGADEELVVFDEPIIPNTIRSDSLEFEHGWVLNDDETYVEYEGEICEFTETFTQFSTETFYSYSISDSGTVRLNVEEQIRIYYGTKDSIIGKRRPTSGTGLSSWYKIERMTQGTSESGSTTWTLEGPMIDSYPTARNVDPEPTFVKVSGSGILYGKPYTHQTRETTYTTGASGVENIASLSDNTLITLQNGKNVADRLVDYYGNADTQKLEIKMNGEKTGEKYSFTNAFNESKTGILARITMSVSSFIKAACEIITGLLYPGKGTLYTNVVVNSSSGTWTVPTGVTKIRAVLIGGGSGGDSGYAGEAGEDADTSGGNGGEGGNGGTGGKGGRIYQVELAVTPGDTITYTVGTGGSGGVGSSATHETNQTGSTGGNSTITAGSSTYSSASGFPSESGFYEQINKATYAKPSLTAGTKGGDGGKGGTAKDYSYDDTTVGEDGEDVGSYSGGSGGTFGTFSITVPTGSTLSRAYSNLPQVQSQSISWLAARYHGTGGGGGACATSAGNAGTGASGTSTSTQSSSATAQNYLFKAYAHGMNGGAGKTPSTPSAQTVYGNGGDGGHGGSGGGGGGATNTQLASASVTVSPTTTTVTVDTQLDDDYTNCKGGTGGSGGNGGDGAPGCVIIYYPD